jgi:hypothetical protein
MEQPHYPTDYKSILEIIHKDANESLKFFYENINLINTRLAVIIGFDASFVSFLSKIPSKRIFTLTGLSEIDKVNHSSYSQQIIAFFTEVINHCFLTPKSLIGFSLIISLFSATIGLLPKPNKVWLLPANMLAQANTTEEEFKTGIINDRHEVIIDLQKVTDKKAKALNNALLSLGIGATIAIIFIIFDNSITNWS